MKEDEPKDLASIFKKREEVHQLISRPEPKVASDVVENQMADPYANLEEILRDPEGIIKTLGALKQASSEQEIALNARELCIDFIDLAFGGPARAIFMDALEQKDFTLFAFWFDVTFGMSYPLGKISSGQDFQEGTMEQRAKDAITSVSEVFDQSISDDTEGYLRSISEAREASILLQEDPTGFLVIDGEVEKLKKDTLGALGRDWQVPEFVIAGAEFAQEAYKKIYPLAEACLAK